MLTDVVIGSFTSASLLDLLAPGADGRGRQRLVAVGLAAYLPTAATGVNDWADTEPVSAAVRRAGLVHAASNAVGASLYAASWSAARRGDRGRGTLLGLAGMTVMMAGGYLGGHLSLTRGVGPDQTVFDPGPSEWTTVGVPSAELGDGRPHRIVVDDTPVLVLREDGRYYAIHDRCSHRGCSLSEGSVEGEEIVCACHGSRFDRRDGSVRGGPATAPQPAFEVREQAGALELRRLPNS
jgi:nitrite reductase/ring-hydroxylating ferredoxin subunit